MMASVLAKLRLIPRALWAMLVIQVLLVLLLVSSIGSLFSVGTQEALRANNTQQRVVIDARTGKVLSPQAVVPDDAAATPPSYDIASSEEEEAEKPAPEPVQNEKPATPKAAQTDDAAVKGGLDLSKEPAVSPIPRGQGSLIPAPAPEVSDRTDKGVLPKTTKDATPSILYAHRYVWPAEAERKPSIAILVSGLGLNGRSMEAALSLPDMVALSFSPYLDHPEWVEWARNAGHEAWMELPAQTSDFPRMDPGPYGVFKGLTPAVTEAHMRDAMMRFSGFVGMTLPLDQAVLTESSVAVTLLEELSKRGLLLAVPSSHVDLSRMAHVAPHRKEILMADAIIDSTPSEAFIRARLARLEDEVKQKGRIFAVVGSTPLSLSIVREWAAGLDGKGIALVPPSALIDRPAPPPPKETEKPSAH